MSEKSSEETRKTLVKITDLHILGDPNESFIEVIVRDSIEPLGRAGAAYSFVVARYKIRSRGATHLLPGSELAIEHRGALSNREVHPIALYCVVHPEREGLDKISNRPFYRF